MIENGRWPNFIREVPVYKGVHFIFPNNYGKALFKGNLEDGKPSIVEYYEMSKEMAEARASDGSLEYKYGVILNYLFALDKLEEIVNNQLTIHVVEKKITHIDENGDLVNPTEPNGYKVDSARELLKLNGVRL